MKKIKSTFSRFKGIDIVKFLPVLLFVFLVSSRDARLPQRAIDGGLFISGEIKYSDNSLMFDSFNSSFTLLHYLTALLIKLNIDFYYISFIVQFINLLILSVAIYTLNIFLNNHILLNYFSIFIILNALPYFIKSLTLNYPLIVNSEHTYGQYGISLSLLTISLFLNKRMNFFVFIISFFASIHVGWMLSTLLVIIIFKTLSKTKLNLSLNQYKIFLLSVILQSPFWFHSFYLNKSDTSNLSNDSINFLYLNYVNNWDYHRSFGLDFQKINIHLIIIACLILLNLVLLKFNFPVKKLIYIVLINSALGILLTYIDINIFNKSFIFLNSYMPGKIINLSLILYILIVVSLINIILRVIYNFLLKSQKISFNFFMIFFFIILCYFFYLNLNSFNFIKLNPLQINYSHSYDKKLCEKLSSSDSVTLSIGDASRFVPLSCRQSILIDTTQIDFIPYARNSLPKLKDLMENVFGLDFESRQKSSEFVGIDSIPMGGIDQALVTSIWENRNQATWEFLSCKYKFRNIVVPKEIILKLEKIYSGENYIIYAVSTNCDSKSNQFVGDFNFMLPKEILADGNYFYWITDKKTNLNVKRTDQSKNQLILQINILPNPCKNNYFLKIYDDLKNEIIEVGSEKKTVNFQFEVSSIDFDKIFFELQSQVKPCEIEGEARNLVALIKNIELKYVD